jgi:PAT family beta-lactamase induction signal transducer AmpG
MYKQLGLGNAEVAYYTGWFYLPWLIKPLWSPFVDLLRTKRWWIVAMQLLMGAGMAGIAFTLPMATYLQWTLAIFWLLAFSSSTHDIAADGFYMMALDEGQQSFFVGIRSTFYRLATLTGQGAMLIVVDWLVRHYDGNVRGAWMTAFFVVAVLFILVGLYHAWILPHPKGDSLRDFAARDLLKEFTHTFIAFFQKEGVVPALLCAHRQSAPSPVVRELWACGVVTLALGSCLMGVLEIYGTTSALMAPYRPAGVALLVLSCVAGAMGKGDVGRA